VVAQRLLDRSAALYVPSHRKLFDQTWTIVIVTSKEESLDDICKRFNDLKWHDSKLIGYSVLPSKDGSTHDVHFQMEWLTDYKEGIPSWAEGKLTIRDCTVIKADLDLDGKHVCDDSIANALCVKESDLKREIEHEQLKHEQKPLAEYLHFRILLIAPGGEINLFAKGFNQESING